MARRPYGGAAQATHRAAAAGSTHYPPPALNAPYAANGLQNSDADTFFRAACLSGVTRADYRKTRTRALRCASPLPGSSPGQCGSVR